MLTFGPGSGNGAADMRTSPKTHVPIGPMCKSAVLADVRALSPGGDCHQYATEGSCGLGPTAAVACMIWGALAMPEPGKGEWPLQTVVPI